MFKVPNPPHIPTCFGAPAGVEADCGQPGPHGPHPLGQLLPDVVPTDLPDVNDPDWCVIDHAEDRSDDLVLHQGDDHTDGLVHQLLDPAALDIRVSRTDCPSEGRIGTPTLYVRAEVELTTWEQAAKLARTILDSFGYLHGAEQ